MYNIPDFLRITPEMQEHFANGEMTMYEKGGKHGGLDRWFAEKWVDIKTGKECGRQEGEERKGYPACRPSRRINKNTPKTSGELSAAEREKFKREKTSSNRIDYQHNRKEEGGNVEFYNDYSLNTNDETMMASGGNVPTNPSLWSRAKSAAKSKYDVYPSAYANGYAAKWYKERGGGWKKAEYGGMVEEYGNGGYTVRRSSERKGKTHVVIGPDGTKKYFGDAKLGQHPRDPERKKAFYARHKHNLANNPYFRAFARATWEDGGEVPEFEDGGNYGAFYGRRDAAKMQGMFNPTADSMTPSFFAMGGLNQYQDAGQVLLSNTANTGQGINTTSPAWSPSINPMASTPNITTAGLDTQNQNQITMDEKQITTKSPTDDTKMEPNPNPVPSSAPAGSLMNSLNQGNYVNQIGKGIEQLQNAGAQALGATSILSRGFGNSQQNAVLDFNRKQDNPTNYLNQVSNFAGVQYAKNGGTMGEYKEGDELELTPTQMYLLERKGYKFQILNK